MPRFEISHFVVNVAPEPLMHMPAKQTLILDYVTRNVGVGYDWRRFSAADQAALANLRQLNFRSEVRAAAESLLRNSRTVGSDRHSSGSDAPADESLITLLYCTRRLAALCRRLRRRNGFSGLSTDKS